MIFMEEVCERNQCQQPLTAFLCSQVTGYIPHLFDVDQMDIQMEPEYISTSKQLFSVVVRSAKETEMLAGGSLNLDPNQPAPLPT